MTPLTISLAGVVTEGTPITFTGNVLGFDSSITVEHENITSMNSRKKNLVILEEGLEITVNVYQTNDGTRPDKIRNVAMTADAVKLVWIKGTSPGRETHTLRATRGSQASQASGKGQQPSSISLVPADFGADTYTIVLD